MFALEATASAVGVEVRNGSVVGMGHHGLFLAADARVEGVRAAHNHEAGIWVEDGSHVEGSLARLNGVRGIRVGDGSSVRESTATQNGSLGIEGGVDARISQSVARMNGSDPVHDGILCGVGCTVVGCTSAQNWGAGIRPGAFSGYRDNMVRDNDAGTVVGAPTSAETC